ncbi:hypothetical protein FH972_019379 [Carpinus fangiana]|uniref:Uncharacterized protein n=1 Tax=Carpinus fangiana TaxID=176857 RepID=A0A5N6RT81_9ROSI|nr:hypothetical protein FH972_019379 [Carpinus fangiana]
MEIKAASTVLEKDNYGDWSVGIKSYLMAQDLWNIIESTIEPPKQEDDEAAFKDWSDKNFMALQLIQNSCGSDTVSEIKEIKSAKIAWNTLAEKYNVPKNTSTEKNMAGNVDYIALIKAVHSGDWKSAKEFLKLHPSALSEKITFMGKTALHIAVAAGHTHIVEEIVERMSEESLEIRDNDGCTALAETTSVGNHRMAECMLRKNKHLVSIGDVSGRIPVVMAIEFGYKDLARYLYSLTPLEDLMPEKGISGATLCTQAIYTRTLDIALHLIQRYRPLALASDKEKFSPLYALASMPYAFPSGSQLVFWKRWIYSCIRIESACATNEICLNIQQVEKRQIDQVKTMGSVLAVLQQMVSSTLLNLLGVKHLYEMKLAHVQSHELLRHMCEEISNSNDEERRRRGCVYSAIFRAIKEGIFEFVYEIVRGNPDLVWCYDENRRTIFLTAVLHRQSKILSLIYRLQVKNAILYSNDDSYHNILHMAGMSADSTQLNRIPGAALQMQRELQWFKVITFALYYIRSMCYNDSLAVGNILLSNILYDPFKAFVDEGESRSSS